MSTSLTLGLDLGPNSIGWALTDDDNPRLIAAGVRVFPEGVDRDKQGGEKPKNQQRRIARGMRRQIARRARRKELLREALVRAGQLNDTAYVTTQVREYLERIGYDSRNVVCTKGQHTAELRWHWGLNKVLRRDDRDLKNREDHRHHAVDAVVIALTNRSRLQQLARLHKQGGVELTGEVLADPWPHLREEVERVINAMNVSHRVERSIHGALHEDTIYGPTAKPGRGAPNTDRPWAKNWVEEPGTFVRRKKVAELKTTGQLEKVRDLTIRELLRQHLRRFGIDPDKPGSIPPNAFSGENTPRMPSGVPIVRVRMLEESETFRPISARRNLQYAKPGNNHHVIYRAVQAGEGEQWRAEVVPMWDAALRVLNHEPVIDRMDRPAQRFVMSLSIGEAFEMDGDPGKRLLCIVRKLDQRSKRVFYKLHYDARRAKELDKENLYLTAANLQQRRARKVTVDPLGRPRWAKD